MAKHLACNDVVHGCGFTATAPTEQELVEKAAAHARETHGVKEISPELAAKIKSVIQDR